MIKLKKIFEKKMLIEFMVASIVVFSFYYLLDQYIFFKARTAFQTIDFVDNSLFIYFLYKSPLQSFLLLSPILLLFLKKTNWENINKYKLFKYFAFSIAILICWVLCLEDYNYYLDNSFVFDRIFIVILGLLILINPVFIYFFALFTTIFYAQYFAVFDWVYREDFKPLFNSIYILSAIALVGIGIIKEKYLVMYILVAIFSSYFYTAVAKLMISPNLFQWVFDNEMYLLPLNAQLRGWLNWIDPDIHNLLFYFFYKFEFLIALFVFLLEFVCVIGLKNRRTSIILLILFSCMHLGIALSIGLFFWSWFATNILVIILLFFYNSIFFEKNVYLKSILCVIFGLFIFKPFPFAWFDSRYQWFSTIVVEDEEKNEYYYNRNDFGGYSYIFAHDFLHNIIPHSIPGINGYSDSYFNSKILRNINFSNLEVLVEKNAINHYNQDWLNTTESFLNKYFANYNKEKHFLTLNKWLRAPRQLYMYNPKIPSLPISKKAVELSIVLDEYVFIDNGHHKINSTELLELDLKNEK